MDTTKRLAIPLGLALCGLLGTAHLAHSGTVDAVSGSSIKVTGGSTTANSATLNFTFGRSGGTRRCYYDIADHTAVSGFTKFATTSGNSFTISGLAAGTKYFYWIQISQSGEKTGSLHTTGTVFKTDGSSAVELRRIPSTANRTSFDPLGRSLGGRQGVAPVQIDRGGAGIRIEPAAP